MHQTGTTPTDLATAVEVDPKTVERWLDKGRVPHQRHRARTARALETEETYLWPALLDDERTLAASQAEVRTIYPHRGAVPPDLWRRLLESAEEHFDLLVYAGLFFVDGHPDFPASLAERAQEGLRTRLLYGDPDSTVVASRGEEEGIGANLAARIRLSLTYMAPTFGVNGVEARHHDTVLYNSLYRFDDEMLVNLHVFGFPAAQNPVLHLQRVPGGQLFDHYLRSFEHVWESARPLEAAARP